MDFKAAIKQHFKIDDIGEMKEYVGNKIECTSDMMKLTQPVLIQSLKDEFKLPDHAYKMPAAPGTMIYPCPPRVEISKDLQK